MINTILLDYGQTIMQIDKKQRKENLEKIFIKLGLKLTVEQFNRGYEIYLAYSRGKIKTEEEYMRLYSCFIGLKQPLPKEVFDAVREAETISSSVVKMLKELKRKYRLAIVANNVTKFVDKGLERYKIKNLFDAVIVSSDVGIRKPDPRIFTYALRKLNVEPEQCVFVSDELNDDLGGAKVLGIKTVWIKNSEEEEEITFQPDFTISSLQELPLVMQRL